MLRRKRGRGGLRLKTRPGEARSSSLDGSRARAQLAAQGARDGRRPRVLISDPPPPARLVATSLTLAKALDATADLVLFGQQSSDSDGPVLWGAVAERLRAPSSPGRQLKLDGSSLTASADGVRLRRDRAPLPAVVAVADSIETAALPIAEGDHGCEVEAAGDLSLADLDVDAGQAGEDGSRTDVLALSDPRRARHPQDRGRRSGAEQIVASSSRSG